MRAVIQRVSQARVIIDEKQYSKISSGLLIFLGIEQEDNEQDIQWLSGKVARLRIFPDQNDIMNIGLIDTDKEVLVVSQFTLHASTKKGNRPSYIKAAIPDVAIPLYTKFIDQIGKDLNRKIKTGSFGAMMHIELTNDGPVTILIDSKNRE